MKGITPVVAIILLLMITISMVGFAFVWFNQMLSTVTSDVEDQVTSDVDKMNQKIDIINIAPDEVTVSIRNIGSVGIEDTQLAFFIGVGTTSGGAPVDCAFSSSPYNIGPGSVATCTLADNCGDVANEKLKVTAPGNIAIYSCS